MRDREMSESKAAMETLLKIVKESMKLIPRNGKIMVSVALFSFLPSLPIKAIVSFHGFLTDKVDRAIEDSLWSDDGYTPNQIIAFHLAPLLLAAILLPLASAVLFKISATALVRVSAVSYAGKRATLPDLVATIRRKLPMSQLFKRGPLRRNSTSKAFLYAFVVSALTKYLVVFDVVNAAAVAVAAAACAAVFANLLYASVEGMLGWVVAVLEEGGDAAATAAAAEEDKARDLAVGHRLQGFVLNLLVFLSILIAYFCYYVNVSPVTELLFFAVFTAAMNFLGIAYTVLYFECKKHHGQEISMF